MKNGFFIIFISSTLFASCSVSSSSGRKDFEAISPQLRTKNEIDAFQDKNLNNADTCWSQLASEPLLFVQKNSELQVKVVENNEIEVCVLKKRGSNESL